MCNVTEGIMKLFLDDVRTPPDGNWIVKRSSKDGIEFVLTKGCPTFISFDHDLGGEDTSMIFINDLITNVLDQKVNIPDDFDYYVHSANPVGSENIKSKMNNFLQFINKYKGQSCA